MSDAVKIVSLELENVKRVQVVHLAPSATGLTVIGGDNCQGKTSILDAIMFALGGEKYRPTNLQRDGALADAYIGVSLSNGLVVERKGKNAALRVTDPSGQKAGQKLLDSFVDELALNLPKFLAAPAKDKADVLLRILGIGDRLKALDLEENRAYQEREAFGRVADQKAKYYAELPWHPDVPEAPVGAGELVQAAQTVMRRNAQRQAARANAAQLQTAVETRQAAVHRQRDNVVRVAQQLEQERERLAKCEADLADARTAVQLSEAMPVDADESTAAIEAQIADMEATNAKVRANLDKAKAKADAEDCSRQYAALTAKVEDVRTRRRALLDGAAMPLAGLSVESGELVYDGKAWDCMSGAEQVRVGVAIVRRLKPACGFVLLDGLEQFDLVQLEALGEWLVGEGLQAIATRVSKGEECSIVIQDGLVVGAGVPAAGETETKAGEEW